VDLSALPVIDGHAHPLLIEPWTVPPERFLDLFSEARPGTMRAHVPHTGYFRRSIAALAQRLGVAPSVEALLERRAAAGAGPACAMLAEARVEALLIDTGYPAVAMELEAMRRLLPCACHEVFRIERCAERLLGRALPYADFLQAFRGALHEAARHCVAFKTIVAYRSGLAVRPWPEVDAALAYRQAVARAAAGPVRLTDAPLLDTLVLATLDVARETGRPVQVHAGFGDPDIDLGQANPALLRPLLEDPQWAGVAIVLLHMAYPYTREAAYMTAVWPQVYLDLSLALPFLGPGAVAPLGEILALAPASKLMYGSDVSAIPELFALSAAWGRAALGGALEARMARGDLTEEQALADAAAILAGNASALYRLPAT
jgi:predicted TIM-barrel fold metal-dependent hydrolase